MSDKRIRIIVTAQATYTEVEAPKSQKDWPGHYVVNKHEISNAYGVIPKESILQLLSVTINKNMKALPCPCCRVQLRITAKCSMEDFIRQYTFIKIMKF